MGATVERRGPLSLWILQVVLVIAATWVSQGAAAASGRPEVNVECSRDRMNVLVPKKTSSTTVTLVELSKWGHLPGCGVEDLGDVFMISLSLHDDLTCGTTRVRNKLTGDMLFYHRVRVTTPTLEEHILVKCSLSPGNETFSNIVKRDVLPPEFVEPDFIEITSEVTGSAPIPILNVGVRQNGNLVGGEINVVPGTPLTMEVYLDNASAGTYGILMSYMEVTDTQSKKETIVYNGCSMDTYLFENFVTNDGDYLKAKFRAFKFPESTYVLFRGTVDVCLDKCQGIQCSNEEIGFGRRRRGVESRPTDPNKVFEVTMMTFLKVDKTTERDEMVDKMTNPLTDVHRSRSASLRLEEEVVEEVVEEVEEEVFPERTRETPSIVFSMGNTMSTINFALLFCSLITLFVVQVSN